MEIEQFAGEYKIHCLLGDGGQANVYLGSKDNQLYALKVYQQGINKEEAFKIEVDFLSKLSCPYLINMVDSKQDAKIKLKDRPPQTRPLLVLELAQGGELFEFLSKQGKFKPQVCRVYLQQLISAIKYLADVGVSHRDLKPENILFDKDFKLKVSDFGLSRNAEGDNKDFKLFSKVGTEGYKPPEMELGKYTGLQSDIFATGVVLFIMYNGTPPFMSTKAHDKIYKLIREKNFPKFWSLHEKSKPLGFYPDSFKRLLNSFFSAEPDRRPTFQSLADDEWLKGDQMMLNEIKQYMQAKYDKIAQTDQVKKKIAQVKKDLYLKYVMEQECCNEELEDRGDMDEFITNYQEYKITNEQLPLQEKNKVVYIKQNGSFVVAWLKNWMKEQFVNKQIFIEQFAEEIAPINFKLNYNAQQYQLSLIFNYQLGSQSSEELKLIGKLHKNGKEEVGIEWTKCQGNDFWLTTIQSRLNETLRVLA